MLPESRFLLGVALSPPRDCCETSRHHEADSNQTNGMQRRVSDNLASDKKFIKIDKLPHVTFGPAT